MDAGCTGVIVEDVASVLGDSLRTDDIILEIDAKEMRETTTRVMERYQIPADRSEDLRAPAAD